MCKKILFASVVFYGTPWNWFKSSSKVFSLTVRRRFFFCGSFMLFLSRFCYAFMCVCLLMPCGHLLRKGWPLGSRLWCPIMKLSLSHWYPGSGVDTTPDQGYQWDSGNFTTVVLDCIDSWYLPSFLLSFNFNFTVIFNNDNTIFLLEVTNSLVPPISFCHQILISSSMRYLLNTHFIII